VEIACQFAALNRKQRNGEQVLFCAPSNHAVDVAASKCSLLHRRNFVLRLSVPHSPCRGGWRRELLEIGFTETSVAGNFVRRAPSGLLSEKRGPRGFPYKK